MATEDIKFQITIKLNFINKIGLYFATFIKSTKLQDFFLHRCIKIEESNGN